MTAALEGGEWSAARPGRTLPPGKTRYLFYRRLGGPQGRSGRAENLIPTGIRSRTAQPAVSRYTDWATRPTSTVWETENFLVRTGIRKSSLGCSCGSFQLCVWVNACEVRDSCSNDDKISSLLGLTPCRLVNIGAQLLRVVVYCGRPE